MNPKPNGSVSIPLQDISFMLWKNRVRFLAAALVGALLGGLLVLINHAMVYSSQQYDVSASIAITTQNQYGNFTNNSENPNYQDIYLAENMADSVIYVATSVDVLQKVIDKLELVGVGTAQVQSALTVTQYKSSQIILLQLRWYDAIEGVQILSCLTETLPDFLIDSLKLGSVSIIEEPKTASAVIKMMGAPVVAVLALIGLILMILYQFLKLLLRPTFLSARSVEEALEITVMGEIPQDKAIKFLPQGRLVASQEDLLSAAFVESYASSAHILKNRLRKRGCKVFYVTSALSGEGKTTVSANLALSFSQQEQKVLLVDFDTRRPSLTHFFLNELDKSKSLNAVSADATEIADAAIMVAPNLDLIPAYLDKERVTIDDRLIQKISSIVECYDYVILDASPVGLVSDAMRLNDLTKEAVFVIRQDMAWQELVADAVDRLQKADTEVIGCLLNNVDVRNPGNRYYYRYYGYNYGELYQGKTSPNARHSHRSKKIGSKT